MDEQKLIVLEEARTKLRNTLPGLSGWSVYHDVMDAIRVIEGIITACKLERMVEPKKK